MKKISVLFLCALMLLSLIACSPAPEDPVADPPEITDPIDEEPEVPEVIERFDPVAAVDGFSYYSDPAIDIQFQYPEDFVAVSKNNIDDEEIEQFISDTLGMQFDDIKSLTRTLPVLIFNEQQSTENTSAYFSFTASSANGHTYETLTHESSVEAIRESYAEQYKEFFGEFEWIAEPVVEEHGNIPFICYALRYEQFDNEIASYQAITALDGIMYHFSYNLDNDEATAGTKTMFDETLATVELA
jgi:hypothetical protein